jgi:hypothetical protein
MCNNTGLPTACTCKHKKRRANMRNGLTLSWVEPIKIHTMILKKRSEEFSRLS